MFFAFIKTMFYMRIYEHMSFLVHMLVSVLYELRHFMLFYILFNLYLSFLAYVLINQDSLVDSTNNDNEFNLYDYLNFVKYFIMVFRTALGDFDIEDYFQNNNFRIITWIVWAVIIIFGNVVFMNFIIAVVNEGYEGCMLNKISYQYKIKLDMIAECEVFVSFDRKRRSKEQYPDVIIY